MSGANRFTGARDSINSTGPVKMTKHMRSMKNDVQQ
ncbi:hypothetical protein FOPG_16329 [Fusarium oxysporum f. sp. conglutinans race 2 54008]|uniref:Uncharacterized protein n=1 Tax=Fusarium oxysporum f. sp. conglutinans race 2 54008 TaxID=1089457 RepID=X0I2N1_FUSOX|nr:hypothetical protein FOPG_16329 [Fusarium oxysporum f. sp. conglutinans race 2 54008]